jgi:hypothetical protein
MTACRQRVLMWGAVTTVLLLVVGLFFKAIVGSDPPGIQRWGIAIVLWQIGLSLVAIWEVWHLGGVSTGKKWMWICSLWVLSGIAIPVFVLLHREGRVREVHEPGSSGDPNEG